MMLSRDQSQLEGRWFWGAYQEFGMDTAMRRSTAGANGARRRRLFAEIRQHRQ